MWDVFALSVLVGVFSLWVPGFFLLRSMRVDRLVAVCSAPVLSTAIYGVAGIAWDKLGIAASFATLVLPIAFFAVVCYVAAVVLCGRKSGRSFDLRGFSSFRKLTIGGGSRSSSCLRLEWRCLAAYVLAGVAFTLVFFVRALPTADSFVQIFDNVHHLGMIRVFSETGCWSSLNVAAYPSDYKDTIMPLVGWSFYPTVWHSVAAMMVTGAGASVSLAANATNFLFVALVFPSSIFVMLGYLFRDNALAMWCGVVLSFCFVAFPWKFLCWGPLFPNLASFSLLPAVAFFFMKIFEVGYAKDDRVRAAALFVVGLVSLTLTQTNAVFTMAVFLAPYCVVLAMGIPRLWGAVSDSRSNRLIAGSAMLLLICLIWIALYNAPPLASVVQYTWPASADAVEAVMRIVALALSVRPQYVLGVAVLVGLVVCLKDHRYRWMVASYVFMCVICFFAASSEGTLKHLLAGFWYTDCVRLEASAVLFAIPITCAGVSSAIGWLAKSFSRGGDVSLRIASAAVMSVLLALVVVPGIFDVRYGQRQTSFGDIFQCMEEGYGSQDDNIYDTEERRFVSEVEKVTEGALIINVPDDGSAYAYGVDGLNVLYRYPSVYGGDDETPESKLIRGGLCDIEDDDDVRLAVRLIGAEYVLQLDQGEDQMEHSPHLFTYEAALWPGLNAIDDDTPGFEVVLARGDMRLYRVVA